jgi:hypothetical protein
VSDAAPPAFTFSGGWPFTGTPTVNGHALSTVTAFVVGAGPDSIPVVTLTLVGPEALKLVLDADAAKVQVDDGTREALISLGWQPPK